MFDLCFRANLPNAPEDCICWAFSPPGSAFCEALVDKLEADITPDEFVLVTLTLLSYYRIRARRTVYVPTRYCEEFFTSVSNLKNTNNEEHNGGLLERVVFGVIGVGCSLNTGPLRIPYLRPYQLDACMDHNLSTMQLQVYCFARMTRTCSHWEAIRCVNEVFGLGSIA